MVPGLMRPLAWKARREYQRPMMTVIKAFLLSAAVITAVLVVVHLNCLGYLDRQ